jgi:hypothetical protein
VEVKSVDIAPVQAQAGGVVTRKRVLTLEELKKFYTEEKGRITTDWVEPSMRQRVFEAFWDVGYIPVMSEGKCENGQCYYRKAFKFLTDIYPNAEKVKPTCKTGVSKSTFDERNAELLKDGYTLMQMQTFTDAEGDVRYCACWVKILPPSE